MSQRCVHGLSENCGLCSSHHLFNFVRSMDERINELENLNPKCFDANIIGEIEKKIAEVERKINLVLQEYMNYGKIPHKCPVCNGSGGVAHPLTGMLARGKCTPCQGSGIVWN